MEDNLVLDWQAMKDLNSRYRARLINTISGFKSANLIGTRSVEGKENLAVFNSLVHIGASPPYFGFILRPTTVDRHTYENIKTTGYYTINQVHSAIHRQAHKTSGKFPRDISEFEACGLKTYYEDDFQAPFVRESVIKIGMSFVEEQLVKCNGTILVIGQVELIRLPAVAVADDGHVDLAALDTVAISGLESYFSAVPLGRYDYYRPGDELKPI